MKVFISHNKANKATARLVAQLLVGQGSDIWFDEWDLQPGDSIAGGIEAGLQDADVFLLLWSKRASDSNWVGAEYKAFLHRKIADEGLRIVPIGLDETPFPPLVTDYKGFVLEPSSSLEAIVHQILGKPSDIEIAKILQAKLNRMMSAEAATGDPLPYVICPSCCSENLRRSSASNDKMYIYTITCAECGWSDWTE